MKDGATYKYNGNHLVAKVKELLKAAKIPYNSVHIEKTLKYGLSYEVYVCIDQAGDISGFEIMDKIKDDFYEWYNHGVRYNIGVQRTTWSFGRKWADRMPYEVMGLRAYLD